MLKQLSVVVLVLVMSIFGLIICSSVLWFPQRYNNQRLKAFADNLYNYPLPPKTEVISQRAEVGLMGNGNHCDFVVEQSLVTKLNREEITSYYEGARLPVVDKESQLAIDGLIPIGLSFGNDSPGNGDIYFKLKIVDVDYPPGFDIRCH
jgi:hypothetical protein